MAVAALAGVSVNGAVAEAVVVALLLLLLVAVSVAVAVPVAVVAVKAIEAAYGVSGTVYSVA